MKEKMKAIAPHFAAGVINTVLIGASGSFGLAPVYQLLLAYMLGVVGHAKLAELLAAKMSR